MTWKITLIEHVGVQLGYQLSGIDYVEAGTEKEAFDKYMKERPAARVGGVTLVLGNHGNPA